MHTDRPRRSALFVPGASARALAKASALPADVVIVDLEDAVAPAAKEGARAAAVAALAAGSFRAERVLRVNGEGTRWHAADLEAAAWAPLDAVCLPKVESPEALRAAAEALDRAGASPSLGLWAMVETPRGVLWAREIALATPRLACLVAGTSDLTRALRARPTPGRAEVLASLSQVVLAARAAGLSALDGVHLDLADPAGLEAACRQGRELGFDGKTLIHPGQLEAANRIFAPAEEELALARRIVEAHARAVAEGQGVVVVEGRLIEALHVAEAERLLALAQRIRG
jgi:citrate lyase subunit beta / citryl-CoA lyase